MLKLNRNVVDCSKDSSSKYLIPTHICNDIIFRIKFLDAEILRIEHQWAQWAETSETPRDTVGACPGYDNTPF